jgi:beta-lactam-binding protein with PASTA domain
VAGPGSASAFTGESVVLNPGKTDLTGPAKTIITNPTFLPDAEAGASALGGVAEASGAASIFEASTLLPSLGAFGLGTVIGSEICHVVGISGCWQLTGTTATETAPTYNWEFIAGPNEGPEPYSWRWTGGMRLYRGKGGYCPGSVPAWPVRADYAQEGSTVSTECRNNEEGSFVKVTATNLAPWRHSMEGRSLGYSATDTAMPNYEPSGKPYEASPTWGEKLTTAIKGQSDSTPAGRVAKHIASQIAGSKVSDPYPHKVTIPDCGAYLWGKCAEAMEELGLEPVRVKRTWETAVITKPADAVVETSPSKGAEVMAPSKVTVTTNPEEAGMPLIVPKPESGETYSHYAARLNPGLSPTRHDLEAAFVSPSTGPNGVVSVEPAPETRLDPATSHEVKVSTNPADAPAAAPAWAPPAVPPIDMSPLSGLSPCGVFPFGLFCWVGEAFAQFNTTGVCPHFSAPVAGTESDFAVTLCGETSETIMGYLRPAILLAFIVGCGFLFARGTKAVGGGD